MRADLPGARAGQVEDVGDADRCGQPAGGDQPWGAPAVGHGQSAAGGARSPLGGLAAIVGGLATIVGLFLPWLESNQDGTDATSGWNLTSGWSPATGANELTSNDPYIVLGLGIAALVIGFMLMQGAVRPLVDVPVFVPTGDRSDPGSTLEGGDVCALFGSTAELDAETLADMHGSADAYLEAFRSSADELVEAGFLLPADAEDLLVEAAENRARF